MEKAINNDGDLPSQPDVIARKRKDVIKEKLNANKNVSTAPYSVNGFIHINNANNIHLGHNVSVVTSPPQKTLQPQDFVPEMTPQLKDLLDSEDDISSEQRMAVSRQVGSNWRFLGKELAGFSNSQMDQLEEPFRANLQPFDEVIYQMLLKWEDHSKIRPTLGFLARALWKLKMHSAVMSLLDVTISNVTK